MFGPLARRIHLTISIVFLSPSSLQCVWTYIEVSVVIYCIHIYVSLSLFNFMSSLQTFIVCRSNAVLFFSIFASFVEIHLPPLHTAIGSESGSLASTSVFASLSGDIEGQGGNLGESEGSEYNDWIKISSMDAGGAVGPSYSLSAVPLSYPSERAERKKYVCCSVFLSLLPVLAPTRFTPFCFFFLLCPA
jgi:hypothetical protein